MANEMQFDRSIEMYISLIRHFDLVERHYDILEKEAGKE